MGYSISFHALDRATVQAALGGEFPDLAAHVLAQPQQPGDLDRGVLHVQLADLLGGPLGRHQAAQVDEVTELSPQSAQALQCVIHAMAPAHATLIHNSKAGPRFREVFLEQALPGVVGPIDPILLIDRPICGMVHGGYPSWGWLALGEMRGSWARLLNDSPPSLDDTDDDDWLQAIVDGVAGAVDRGKDLITLYA